MQPRTETILFLTKNQLQVGDAMLAVWHPELDKRYDLVEGGVLMPGKGNKYGNPHVVASVDPVTTESWVHPTMTPDRKYWVRRKVPSKPSDVLASDTLVRVDELLDDDVVVAHLPLNRHFGDKYDRTIDGCVMVARGNCFGINRTGKDVRESFSSPRHGGSVWIRERSYGAVVSKSMTTTIDRVVVNGVTYVPESVGQVDAAKKLAISEDNLEIVRRECDVLAHEVMRLRNQLSALSSIAKSASEGLKAIIDGIKP